MVIEARSRWRKFLALPPDDRFLLGEACLRLLEARVRLLVLDFSSATAGFPRSVAAKPVASDVPKIRWAVETAASQWPFSTVTCLWKALAASRMLQARGHAPSLVYGVAASLRNGQTGNFASHAWLELDGKPVVGHREAAGYTILAKFPLEARETVR